VPVLFVNHIVLKKEKVIMFGWHLAFGEGYLAQLINRRIK
jgi:hypothetical protein